MSVYNFDETEPDETARAVPTTRSRTVAELKQELHDSSNVLLYKSWRSQWYGFLLSVIFFVGVHMMAYSYPATLIPFTLGEIGSIKIGIVVPVLMIVPLLILIFSLHSIYDTRYVIRQDALLVVSGLVSYRRHTTEVFYPMVQSIKVDQSVVGRLLNFGNVEIGMPGNANATCMVEGVRSPHQCKAILERRLGRVTAKAI